MAAGRKEKNRFELFSLRSLLHLVFNRGKEAAQGAGGGDGALERLGSPERNNVGNRILETEAVGGALRAQQFYFCGPQVGNQAADSCPPTGFIVQHPSVLHSPLWARARRSRLSWGGLQTEKLAAPAGHGFLRINDVASVNKLYDVSYT
jgi:hypothetical protein